MDLQFDARIFSMFAGVTSLVLCVCMLYMSRTRRVYSGFKYWVIATIADFGGLLLFGLRNLAPDFVSIILANTLLIFSNVILVYGIEVFFDCKRRIWFHISSVMTVVVTFTYFTYITNNILIRVVIISAVMAIIYAYTSYVLYKNVPRMMKKQDVFLIVVFLCQAIWFVFRMFHTGYFENKTASVTSVSLTQILSIIIMVSANMFKIFGLMMLNSQRVEMDLIAAKDEVEGLKGIIPICMHCKGIRDDKGYWNKLEKYINDHTDARLSHGICGDCLKEHYPEDEDYGN